MPGSLGLSVWLLDCKGSCVRILARRLTGQVTLAMNRLQHTQRHTHPVQQPRDFPPNASSQEGRHLDPCESLAACTSDPASFARSSFVSSFWRLAGDLRGQPRLDVYIWIQVPLKSQL